MRMRIVFLRGGGWIVPYVASHGYVNALRARHPFFPHERLLNGSVTSVRWRFKQNSSLGRAYVAYDLFFGTSEVRSGGY